MNTKELFKDFCNEFNRKNSIYKQKHIERIKEAFLKEKATLIFSDDGFSFGERIIENLEPLELYESAVTSLPLNIEDYFTVEHFLKQRNNFDFHQTYEDQLDLQLYWQDLEDYAKRKFLSQEQKWDLLEYADSEFMPEEFFEFKEELYKKPLASLFKKSELVNNRRDYWRAFRDFIWELYHHKNREALTMSIVSFETNGRLLLQRTLQFNRFNWHLIPQSITLSLAKQPLNNNISLLIRERTSLKLEDYFVYRLSSMVFNYRGVEYLSAEAVKDSFTERFKTEVFMNAKEHMRVLGLTSLRDKIEFI